MPILAHAMLLPCDVVTRSKAQVLRPISRSAFLEYSRVTQSSVSFSMSRVPVQAMADAPVPFAELAVDTTHPPSGKGDPRAIVVAARARAMLARNTRTARAGEATQGFGGQTGAE